MYYSESFKIKVFLLQIFPDISYYCYCYCYRSQMFVTSLIIMISTIRLMVSNLNFKWYLTNYFISKINLIFWYLERKIIITIIEPMIFTIKYSPNWDQFFGYCLYLYIILIITFKIAEDCSFDK